ncbi:MAG: hypothetical protein ABIW76_09630, partial [Fibrobacteria bacterium]
GSAAVPLKSHLTHYGPWKDLDIPMFRRFSMVTLQPGMYSGSSTESQAIAQIRSQGALVLLYISLGEDANTYNNAAPAKGDGRGPVHWSPAGLVYGNKGIASYYLDEWNVLGRDEDSVNKVPDGLPDRQGDWGSCYVNAGDSDWQRKILEQAARLMALGADGLFMDTPETANPWNGYGWTAPGMRDLIRRLREAHAGKYLALNRGLFFFDPDYPVQYAVNPRKYLDAVVFESYYTGSDYTVESGGNGSWRANPYFLTNKYISGPRLNAELGRYDSFGSILHIDYAADPVGIAQTDPVFYQRVLQEAVVEQGWIPQIANRLLSLAPTTVIDHPSPADRAAPKWQNTSVSGVDAEKTPSPRPGLLKAIPGNGKVTLRWDVAADQTRPVRYNIYYGKSANPDFSTRAALAAVKAEVGADYTVRASSGANDGCPYEFTVTGLANNALYRFAVRAEDATSGVQPATADGRTGPAGGLEETNTVVLSAIPRDSSIYPIVIDGAFSDWDKVPAYSDSAGEGGTPDLLSMRVTDDSAGLYLLLETAGAADAAKLAVLLNSDSRSHTGDPTIIGTGFRGAEYKWENGALYRFQPWEWIQVASAEVRHRAVGNRLEIRIGKKAIGGEKAGGLNLLAQSVDKKDYFPDYGVAGLAYAYTRGAGGANGIKSPGNRGVTVPAIRITALGSAYLITLADPRAKADILIRDLQGRLVEEALGITGGRFVWSPPARGPGLYIITVRTAGSIVYGKIARGL